MIELQHFSIGYKENSLLHEVNATIKKGQLTALIGRNGTGKSTLLRAIAGLNRCYSGKIILDGHDIACMKTEDMAKTLAVVTTERTRIANLRCKDVVAIGRAPYTNWIGRMQETDKALSMCDSIALLDTPNLSCLTASEMQKSGYIDRLFQNENIRFDSLCGTMILKQ